MSELSVSKFAENFIEVRKFLGLNQKEFADLVDITPAAVCQIEKGLRLPELKTIVKILNKTSIKFERLVRE